MTLTRELLFQFASSPDGGWNKQQLQLMGVPWPPKPGWPDRVIGRELDGDTIKKLFALKGVHLKRDRRVILQGQGGLDL